MMKPSLTATKFLKIGDSDSQIIPSKKIISYIYNTDVDPNLNIGYKTAMGINNKTSDSPMLKEVKMVKS